jgi:hypothetical protein
MDPWIHSCNSPFSPAESVISQYSGNSSLVPRYYYGISSGITSPDKSSQNEDADLSIVVDVGNPGILAQQPSRVSIYIATKDGEAQAVLMRKKSSSTQASSCVDTRLAMDTSEQLLSPVEPVGLRIVMESPRPPIFEGEFSTSDSDARVVTPDSSDSGTTALLLPPRHTRDQVEVTRKIPRGGRVMIRKNPDLKQVRHITPSYDPIHHLTAVNGRVSGHKKSRSCRDHSKHSSVKRKASANATESPDVRSAITMSSSISQDWVDAEDPGCSTFVVNTNSRDLTGERVGAHVVNTSQTSIGLGITGEGSPFERMRCLTGHGA